jgi:hypothetical protein
MIQWLFATHPPGPDSFWSADLRGIDGNLNRQNQKQGDDCMNQSPTITFVFSGLYLFAFESDMKFCQAGVLQAERHCLKVRILTIINNQMDTPSEMEFEVPEGDIRFDIPTRSPGVGIYKAGPFNRTASPDRFDFRWALDLEGPELHNHQLQIIPGSLNRSILISNGVFYTQELRSVRITTPLPSSQHSDVDVAQKIGCSVYLGDGEEALLRYGTNSEFSLKFSGTPNIRHFITLDNICPETMTSHEGDFKRYYEVVDVSPGEQFKVETPPIATGPGPRNPCDPVFMGTSKALLG